MEGKLRELAPRLGAELAIIVLGVLIALWADGCVADRADRAEEASRVEGLRDNVAATRVRLAEAEEEALVARRSLREIAYWEDSSEADENADAILAGLLFGPVFAPEIAVYADLKNSGDLALLRNAALRQELASMDATLEHLELLQADLVTVQQLNLDPFLVREFALGEAFGGYLELEGLPQDTAPPAFDLRVLRNLALFKLDLVDQLVQAYGEVSDAMDRVEGAMEPGS